MAVRTVTTVLLVALAASAATAQLVQPDYLQAAQRFLELVYPEGNFLELAFKTDRSYCQAYALLSPQTRSQFSAEQFAMWGRRHIQGQWSRRFLNVGPATIAGDIAEVSFTVGLTNEITGQTRTFTRTLRLVRDSGAWLVQLDEPSVAAIRETDLRVPVPPRCP